MPPPTLTSMPDKSAVQPAEPPLEICLEQSGSGDWRGSFSLTSEQMVQWLTGFVPLADGTKVGLNQPPPANWLKVVNRRLQAQGEYRGTLDPGLPYQHSEQNFCQHPDGCDCKL